MGFEHLPAPFVAELCRFHWDNATLKVDWNLDGGIPWEAEPARQAGTVHVAEGIDHLTRAAAIVNTEMVPARLPLVMGQMTTSDHTRSPAGTETAWAYAHVPQRVRGDEAGVVSGRWDAGDADTLADRIEAEVERLAPGFRSRIRGRRVTSPVDFERENPNMVGGALNAGSAQLHQMIVFRPTPGLARPTTPISGLYLANASAHPGGGVHGACGANAARAALRAAFRRRYA